MINKYLKLITFLSLSICLTMNTSVVHAGGGQSAVKEGQNLKEEGQSSAEGRRDLDEIRRLIDRLEQKYNEVSWSLATDWGLDTNWELERIRMEIDSLKQFLYNSKK